MAQYTATINNDQSRTLVRVNNTALYAAGLLTIAITKDENWKPGNGCIGTTEIYKNKEGQIVLRRTYDTIISGGVTQIEQLSTYYVYDDFGDLCFVLPPGTLPDNTTAISSTNLDGYCYQYRYDQRNRLTQKKLPGKGWEFTVYNNINQVVMTQTGNQRNKTPQQWTFAKYDAQGRVIVTGIYSYPSSTLDANVDAPSQTEFLALANIYATQTDAQGSFLPWENTNSTTNTSYDEQSYPRGHAYTFLSINYYDSYTNIPSLPARYDQHTNAAYSKMTSSLPTASKTFVLNSPDALWTVNYYNSLGLPITVYKQHYLGGSSALSVNNNDWLSITYNFNKQPAMAVNTHFVNISGVATTVLTSAMTYTYDQVGRQINAYSVLQDHANTAQPKVLLAQNVYNEIGQLRTKQLNAPSPYTNFLQSVDYRYTPRGWLSSINNAGLNMTDATTNTTTGNADQFGEEISYDYSTTGIAQYNGNISSVKWKTGDFPAGSGVTAQVGQQYDYRYDPLSRLINAVSSSAGVKNGLFNENIAYNRMGDITSLGRYDHGLIDSLTYTDLYYQVQKITNTATTQVCPACFVDGVNLSQEYVYDIDGNMTQDKNKGISNITYNQLNLPQTITRSNGNTIVYIYDASGEKLRKVTTVGSNITTTEYIDGIEYDNGALAFVQTDEGRARLSGTTYTYEYDLKDHLGNTRATIKDNGTGVPQVLQIESYYPFGATIASLEPVIPSPKNHYLYNDKEIQDETSLYDYGARLYDPVIGKWTSVDPLAEISRRYSPYNYVENNPINAIDPDGMACDGCNVNPWINPENGQSDNYYKDWYPNDQPNFQFKFQSKGFGGEDDGANGDDDDSNGPKIVSGGPNDKILLPIDPQTGLPNVTLTDEVVIRAIREPSWNTGNYGWSNKELDDAAKAELKILLLPFGGDVFEGIGLLGEAGEAEEVTEGLQYTRSNLQLGQEMHSSYRLDDVIEGVAEKEFRGIPGIRPDFVDFETNTIYELKPFNPRAMQQGINQLIKYQELFQQTYGGEWNISLDVY